MKMIKFIRNLFRTHSVIIVNKLWQPFTSAKITHIPRHGEYIYIEENKQYYVVLNVVYNLINKKQGIFIIVEEYGNEKPSD